jgi:hypothetical protein
MTSLDRFSVNGIKWIYWAQYTGLVVTASSARSIVPLARAQRTAQPRPRVLLLLLRRRRLRLLG